MSMPASRWAAMDAAVASSTTCSNSAGSTGSPRLRRPCNSASPGGRGTLPAWVVRLSIRKALLEVGGLRRVAGEPVEIAPRLRASVLERVGLPITVGVARTKFLAKVASRVAKPDGLLVVPVDRELEFLHPLPVE